MATRRARRASGRPASAAERPLGRARRRRGMIGAQSPCKPARARKPGYLQGLPEVRSRDFPGFERARLIPCDPFPCRPRSTWTPTCSTNCGAGPTPTSAARAPRHAALCAATSSTRPRRERPPRCPAGRRAGLGAARVARGDRVAQRRRPRVPVVGRDGAERREPAQPDPAPRGRAGAPWAGFHTFRHTCASLLFARGCNAVQVQRWLGHHSAAFTLETYVHLLPGDGAAALDLRAELVAAMAATPIAAAA